MLRLRPSELTLTPEDIDEAFRRIAVSQSSRDSRHAPLQTLTQPGRPILRRGPQRAVRDAITTLGDIPILRPQPQQTISSFMDDDVEVVAHHGDSDTGPLPAQAQSVAVAELDSSSFAGLGMCNPTGCGDAAGRRSRLLGSGETLGGSLALESLVSWTLEM